MNTVPEWRLAGDWFDICSCNIPCPCEFAQAPTNNACQGMLVWHIRQGHFGNVQLDGFNLLALAAFEGNLWAGAKARLGLFIDEKADERQRKALQTIFAGEAGGWPAGFAATIGEFRGVEFVPISFEIADDLAHWQAEIPGRVRGRAEALTGPTTPPGKRVQTINPPGGRLDVFFLMAPRIPNFFRAAQETCDDACTSYRSKRLGGTSDAYCARNHARDRQHRFCITNGGEP
jgi:hypothetical protein